MSAPTRQKIVQTAIELFAERGQHGVTLRDISARSGVVLGTITHHFPLKESLYQAAVAQAYDGVAEQIRAALSGPEAPPRERLHRLIRETLRRHDRDDPIQLLIDRYTLERNTAEVSATVRTTFKANYDMLASVIGHGRRTRDSSAWDLDVAYVFSFLAGFAKLYREYGTVLKLRDPDREEAIVEDLGRAILRMIDRPERAERPEKPDS